MASDKQGVISPRDALWASVGIAALLIVSAVVLTIFDKDITALVSIAQLVAIPILTGLGAVLYQRMGNVEGQLNGRMTQLIEHAKNSTPNVAKEKGDEVV